jgi:predicted nucleic acid-binding Zn ribbon protein
MPTYVYKFIDTGETIEVQQAFTDDALTEAEHPGSGKKLKVKKVFTPVGVTFKGGGFYKTDSRGGKSKSSSTTSSTDSSTSSSSSDSSSSSSSSDSSSSNGASKSSDSGTTSATPASKPSTPAKTTSSSD